MSSVLKVPEDDGIAVTGVGCVASVGRDRLSCAAAVCAGVARFFEIPWFMNVEGGRAAGAFAYGLTDERSGSDRLLSMAVPAAQEALAQAEASRAALDDSRTRMFLALGAEERPAFEDFDASDVTDLLESIEAEDLAHSVEILRDGHCGGAQALDRAIRLLYAGEIDHALVGGVDSLVEYPALQWYDSAGRLKTDQRSDGFMPGEAAAFAVIERCSVASRREAPQLANLRAMAFGEEEASVLSEKPLRGIGLSEVVAPLLDIAGAQVGKIVCDLNGEYYRMKEWALAMPRVFREDAPLPLVLHPAENVGDVGAAAPLFHLALVAAGFERGYGTGADALIWGSSDSGTRVALLVGEAS